MKEKEVYDAYQERVATVGEIADKLAWMMVLILCAALIGNKLITSFVVSGALSLVYMLLSLLQTLWQAIGMWIVKRRMNPEEELTDYPTWISVGAWVFFILSVIAIAIAVVYFAKDVYFFGITLNTKH